MYWLIKQITQDRMHAVIVITSTIIIAQILPPIGLLSISVISLVTLCQGFKEGSLLIIISFIPIFIFGTIGNNIVHMFIFAIAWWFPGFLLAIILRWSKSLSLTIEMGLLFSILTLVGQYILLGDPIVYWLKIVMPIAEYFVTQGIINNITMNQLIEVTALLMPVGISASLFLLSILGIFIARWWQAILFNHGGFRKEFHALKLSKTLAIITIPLLLWLFSSNTFNLLSGLGLLIIIAYILQGFALTHSLLANYNASSWLIGGIYVLTITMPHILLAVAIVGYLDVWINFRQHQHIN